jgi:hypothetical protein
MNQTILLLAFFLTTASTWAQNNDTLFPPPQKLELTISTPQPRLKETFQITLDLKPLKSNIIKAMAGKVQLANEDSRTDKGQLVMDVTALEQGKNEIGPLYFSIDSSIYTTNKITFEVIEPIPNTDNGLWFRKVMTSDSSFCIIIEQRIPTNAKTTKQNSSITITYKPETEKLVEFKDNYLVEGTKRGNRYSSTNFSSTKIDGEYKKFMCGFGVYHFFIVDKEAKIKITKHAFDDIPEDYKFENIVIK